MGTTGYLSKMIGQGEAVWKALRLDNWQNVFTGLGTSRDKTQYGRFHSLSEIRESELTALYHQDDMARKVVALKPQEMMRKGFTVSVEGDTEASSAIGMALRDLKAGMKIRDAMIWGRLYGGAALLIGADDGLPAEEPLDESRVKKVKFLHVVDKRHLIPESFFSDPLNDEFFGEPQTYRITPRRGATNLVVHRSRMILFGGAHTSDEERDRLGQWDHSVLTALYAVLRQFNNVWASSEHLMSDASQAVFKIKGLMAMIAGGQKDVLQTRMQLVDMSRSVARAIMLDADGGEEFRRESSSFTDAQNMLEKFMMRLSASADIPVTILMGRSPAGQNATGDADFRWFYDTVATSQENDLKPRLEKLTNILMLSKEGPTSGNVPDVWSIGFAPLWQPTPSEQAELEKKVAEKDKIYIDGGVVLPEEVALSRYRPEGWSPETQIDRELREEVLESDKAIPDEVDPAPASASAAPAAPAGPALGVAQLAIITRVNEGRAVSNLPPLSEEEGGMLFIVEFDAMLKAKGAAVGEAEGGVEADEIDPAPDVPGAVKNQPPPFGAPPAPPKPDDPPAPDDPKE